MKNLSNCNQQDIHLKIFNLAESIIKKYSEFNKYINKKYNNNQLLEILIGLFKGLDISKYASHKFDDLQMLQIRLGLEKNLDVSKYAKPEFNQIQMREIRFGLEEGVNVDKYANPDYDWMQMEKIRLQLLEEKKNNTKNDLQNKNDKLELKLNDKKVLINNNGNSMIIEIK